MSVLSSHLPDEIAIPLANLAKATGRSKSLLVVDALHEYLTRDAWQINETQRAMEEADAGDFASPDEAKEMADK